MIYLRLSITRGPFPAPDNDSHTPESGLAEVMLPSDDPVAASTQAAELLQQQGWRPLAITEAEQGFRREDFWRRESGGGLFDSAEQAGFGLNVSVSGGVEQMGSMTGDSTRKTA